MGTQCRITVLGGRSTLAEHGQRRVEDLERRWSRFQPTSELNRIATDGSPTIVSPETYALVARAVSGWALTAGRFDPTLGGAVAEAGYDSSFELLPASRPKSMTAPRPSSGCVGVELDAGLNAVTLPPGVRIDPGGIGKGYAADLVAEELMRDGASGVLVDLGGDLKALGIGPHEGKWVVDVMHPLEADRRIAHLLLADMGVATSSCHRRRWLIGGDEVHHLIDPSTGWSTTTAVAGATVLASDTWWAEVLTKAMIVSGSLDAVSNASAILVDGEGAVTTTPDLMQLVG